MPAPLWEQYREQFPITKNLVYLNHASVGPLSRRAAVAMQGLAEDALQYGSEHYARWLAAYEGVRNGAARLLNADAGEIAIIKNTSEGIATIGYRPLNCRALGSSVAAELYLFVLVSIRSDRPLPQFALAQRTAKTLTFRHARP